MSTHGDRAPLADAAWHISTRSANGGGNCVEAGALADGSGRVAVRHSKHRDGAVMVYSRGGWEAFIAGVKGGEFDLPASSDQSPVVGGQGIGRSWSADERGPGKAVSR